MEIAAYIVVALVAYLLGSIPTGYLVARAKGVDIRTVGSGNIGATNVFRILGKPAGIFVLLMDALKGSAAVALAVIFHPDLCRVWPDVFGKTDPQTEAVAKTYLGITAGLFAVLGHNYPCWLRFKGGKGIATSAGVLAALVPWALVVILSVWIILFLATRYVSVASMAAAAVLPFATWFTTHDKVLATITAMLGALAIYKHRANIQRLRNGTESRIHFGKKGDAT